MAADLDRTPGGPAGRAGAPEVLQAGPGSFRPGGYQNIREEVPAGLAALLRGPGVHLQAREGLLQG